jgi:hypothetical protein
MYYPKALQRRTKGLNTYSKVLNSNFKIFTLQDLNWQLEVNLTIVQSCETSMRFRCYQCLALLLYKTLVYVCT